MDNPSGEWSRLFAFRDKIHTRYRDIWDVPRVKKRSRLLARYLRSGMKVLDVGAGMRGMKGEIEGLGISVTYRSMDIDRSNPHDYYDLADVGETFDAVIMFEVIEHLDLEGGLALLKRIHEILGPGGIIICSTPNIFNPSRYMRDATHRTFYGYDELCGLLMVAGFS